MSHHFKATRANERIVLVGELLPTFMEAVGLISICIALTVGLQLEDSSSSILPIVAFFALGIVRLVPSFARVTNSLQMLNFGAARCSSVLDEYQQNADSVIAKHPYDISESCGASSGAGPLLAVRNLSFRYNADSPALFSDISFALNPGETVGVIGQSGRGKSTLLEIISGLIPPDSGEVLLKGETNPNPSERLIALVSQSTYFFSTSIRDNLCIERPLGRPSEGELRALLHLVELDYFIESLTDQLDTPIGDGGVVVSGGQAQRLAIARALVSRPLYLLLDEATSALGEDQEARILTGIRKAYPKIGILVVSHRSATIQLCDRVLDLDALESALKRKKP
jgi:ABC-type multidrug transport system fused ATPase/permease subunit